ncbi:MAG: response regulator, partial [Calditrichaeota bacterium]
VAAVKQHPFDLLVLDMVMSGIDGAETYRQIQEINPKQKAIILSGYAMSQRVEEALRLGAETFVSKPIEKGSLLRAVRQAFESGGGNAANHRSTDAK